MNEIIICFLNKDEYDLTIKMFRFLSHELRFENQDHVKIFDKSVQFFNDMVSEWL